MKRSARRSRIRALSGPECGRVGIWLQKRSTDDGGASKATTTPGCRSANAASGRSITIVRRIRDGDSSRSKVGDPAIELLRWSLKQRGTDLRRSGENSHVQLEVRTSF